MMTSPDSLPSELHPAACPYCGGRSLLDFRHFSRTYYRCRSCALIHQMHMEEKGDEINEYYRKRYFHDYADDQPDRNSMQLNRRILDLIEARKKTGNLLDVGCGCGYFLKEAQRRGWAVQGVDLSEESIVRARQLVGDVAFVGTVADVDLSRRFDVITMINVLDHMRDPFQNLRRSRELLQEGGLLYLRFPNGFFHRLIIRMQTMLTDKPLFNSLLVFHEYSFTPAFIMTLLAEEGFHPVTVRNARLSGAALYSKFRAVKSIGAMINGTFSLTAFFVKCLSAGRWLLGPSLDVIATKKQRLMS